MINKSIAEFCIQHDEHSSLMRVAWTAGRRMRHFQQAFTQLRELIKQTRAVRIILELSTMPDVSVYDQLWLSTSFMPALLKLPLKQVVIVLAAQCVYNQHVVEGLLAAVATTITFDVQFFAQPEAAMSWLTDDSPRLPALLAEWNSSCGNALAARTNVAEPLAIYQLRDASGCQPDS
jgi:hypothetical protein